MKKIKGRIGLDRLVDTITKRSTILKNKAFEYVEENYKLEKVMHCSNVIKIITNRLSLAEYCLKNKWSYAVYVDNAKSIGIWF